MISTAAYRSGGQFDRGRKLNEVFCNFTAGLIPPLKIRGGQGVMMKVENFNITPPSFPSLKGRQNLF
jgi:hypothetical protein